MNEEQFPKEELSESDLPSEDLSPEASPVEDPPKDLGVAAKAFDVLEMFAWSMFVVFMLFTFAIRLCNVEGDSMQNTLFNGEKLLLYSVGYTPEQDDIIVFHLTDPDQTTNLEKTLVKRVIATGGQTVKINFYTTEIFVDGVRYEDTHAVFKKLDGTEIDSYTMPFTNGVSYDRKTGILQLQVPEHTLFVMGDNRNNSRDSRDADILFVDERCVLGKVVARVSPFTTFP